MAVCHCALVVLVSVWVEGVVIRVDALVRVHVVRYGKHKRALRNLRDIPSLAHVNDVPTKEKRRGQNIPYSP